MLRFIILDAFIKNTHETLHPPCIRRQQTARQFVIYAGFPPLRPRSRRPEKKISRQTAGRKTGHLPFIRCQRIENPTVA